jgi:hypothetical protein
MSNTIRQTELTDINQFIHRLEASRDKADRFLWRLRTRRRQLTDAIECEAMASTDTAPLERAFNAVLAAPAAPPKLHMQKLAAEVCGIKLDATQRQNWERWDGQL